MTFQEARDKLLLKFDAEVAALRNILAHPGVCNYEFRPLREELENIDRLAKDIITLNNIQASVRR